MNAFSFRSARAEKHWSIRFGIRGNLWSVGGRKRRTPNAQRPTPNERDADDQRDLPINPRGEQLGGRALCFRAAHVLRSALQLLRHGIRVLRGKKADAW